MLRRKNKLRVMDEDLAAEVFGKYSENGKMGPEGLLRFLQSEQGEETATLDDVKQLLEQYRKDSHKLPKLHSLELSGDDFIQFLLNSKLNGPISTAVHQDMNKPLSNYFIFTGHNSYLTGNQLSSDSSDVPIIAALQRGVRVIELDLWHDDAGRIKVTHGNTLTDPVAFEKCIVAIKENAFVASQYPVCITLEDHLSSPLQAQAAQIMTQIFGDALYFPPTPESFKEFPSPESLKGRIIISTKPPDEPANVSKKMAGNKGVVKELEKEDKSEAQKDSPVKDDTLSEKVDKLHVDETVPAAKGDPTKPPCPGQVAVAENDEDEMRQNPAYSRLITIRQAKPAKGTVMKDRLADNETVKRISLAESKLEEVAKESPELLVRFTQRNILRVFPAGVRVDSSNYNPVLAWTHGAQMVALNMQGYGKCLWIDHGFFKANGGCGYVLKPKFLMENQPTVFNPKASHPVRMILKVKVIMSLGWKEAFGKRHFDLFSPPDFFTRLLIAGVPADEVKGKTKVVDNTWIPHWNEDFEFPLTVPELAVLRIEVRDKDDDSKDEFAGQTCLPVSELKGGYRCVQLYDKKGVEIPGVKMLFRFQHIFHGGPSI